MLATTVHRCCIKTNEAGDAAGKQEHCSALHAMRPGPVLCIKHSIISFWLHLYEASSATAVTILMYNEWVLEGLLALWQRCQSQCSIVR
jgi:hypothetical protein